MQLKVMTTDAVERTRSFLKDVRVELSKVTFPSWDELKGQTIVVIVAVFLIAAFIGIVDLFLSNTIKLLVTRLS